MITGLTHKNKIILTRFFLRFSQPIFCKIKPQIRRNNYFNLFTTKNIPLIKQNAVQKQAT